MRAKLGVGDVLLIPTFYYPVLEEAPWLANATDGVLFYFRNDRRGPGDCNANSSTCQVPAACRRPCLCGRCAEASIPNFPAEVAHFAAALPPRAPIHVGIYFTGYSHCDAPSPAYDRAVLSAALALPWVAGVTIYITEDPPAAGGASCLPDSSDKGCIVRSVFGGWNSTPAAKAFDASCPAAMPFRSLQTSGTPSPQLCCGGVDTGGLASPLPRCCCLSDDAGAMPCPVGTPACFCPADRPFEYGSFDGGEFCCRSKQGFPVHCSDGGECCLRPGLKEGCQGLIICELASPSV
jgi:hypothetical protein